MNIKASPGNLQNFEEEIFGSTDFSVSPVICAIKVESNSNETVCKIVYTIFIKAIWIIISIINNL